MPQGKGQDVPFDGVMHRDQEPGPVFKCLRYFARPLCKRAQREDYKKSIDTTYVMVSFTGE